MFRLRFASLGCILERSCFLQGLSEIFLRRFTSSFEHMEADEAQVRHFLRYCLFHSVKYQRGMKREDIKEHFPMLRSEDLGDLLDKVNASLERVFGMRLVDQHPKLPDARPGGNPMEETSGSFSSAPKLSTQLSSHSSLLLVSQLPEGHAELIGNLLDFPLTYPDPDSDTLMNNSVPLKRELSILMIILTLLAAQRDHVLERQVLLDHLNHLLASCPQLNCPQDGGNRARSGDNANFLDDLLAKFVKDQYLLKKVPSKQDPIVTYSWGKRAKSVFPIDSLKSFILEVIL